MAVNGWRVAMFRYDSMTRDGSIRLRHEQARPVSPAEPQQAFVSRRQIARFCYHQICLAVDS